MSVDFYKSLPAFAEFEHFSNQEVYQSLPDDWLIAVSDICGSTKAIENGHYKAVNAIGVASIIAVNNACTGVSLPYVFGGDGATICFPPCQLARVKRALLSSKKMAQVSFSLDLRVGIVPLAVVKKFGYAVNVAKYQASQGYCQALFCGGGLSCADDIVKQRISLAGCEPKNYLLTETLDFIDPDCFDGFECRWDRIKSPHEQVIAVMIKASNADVSMPVYQEVSRIISQIFGSDSEHHPVRKNNLNLTFSSTKLSVERRVKKSGNSWFKRCLYALKLIGIAALGRYLMANNTVTGETHWGEYKNTFVLNTDFRKYDDVLRMVISGTKAQKQALAEALDKLHQTGQLNYGLFASDASIVTCFIKDYSQNHIHFLDVDNGGYAYAAKALKKQMLG